MASTTNKRHRMRCNACRAAGRSSGRFTLKRHPDLYVNGAKCPACGEKNRISSQEKDRRTELERRPSHSCENYPFPHVPGSMRMCTEHPEYILGFEPSDDDKRNYQGVIDTDRSEPQYGMPDQFDIEDDDGEEIPW